MKKIKYKKSSLIKKSMNGTERGKLRRNFVCGLYRLLLIDGVACKDILKGIQIFIHFTIKESINAFSS
jgi:hypothetical protein